MDKNILLHFYAIKVALNHFKMKNKDHIIMFSRKIVVPILFFCKKIIEAKDLSDCFIFLACLFLFCVNNN